MGLEKSFKCWTLGYMGGKNAGTQVTWQQPEKDIRCCFFSVINVTLALKGKAGRESRSNRQYRETGNGKLNKFVRKLIVSQTKDLPI